MQDISLNWPAQQTAPADPAAMEFHGDFQSPWLFFPHLSGSLYQIDQALPDRFGLS
jgi:hypothetical protein